MRIWCEALETPYERWERISSRCRKGIWYCDEYMNNTDQLETDIRSNEGKYVPGGFPWEVFGMPTEQLKQDLKNELKEEFLRYWETL